MRKKPSSGAVPNPDPYTHENALRAQQAEHVVGVGLARRQLDLRHRVERALAAPRTTCRESRSCASWSARRARAAAWRNATWCDRSPVSAAVTAYCIGPGLHSRPSASFLIAASAPIEARRRSDRHPAGAPAGREIRLRQARVGNDRRVVVERRHRRHRAVVGRDRRRPRRRESPGRASRRSRSAPCASRPDRSRRSDCSDRSRRARASSALIRLRM